MTGATVRARDTPGRTASPQQIVGLLITDLDNGRARYDCYRPGCPKRREGPVYGAAIPEFAASIKAAHLAKHHGEHR